MGAFIHQNNVLLELSRMTAFEWLKELCYRKEQYVILSSGGTHTGLVGEEDPLEHDDLEDVYNELIALA